MGSSAKTSRKAGGGWGDAAWRLAARGGALLVCAAALTLPVAPSAAAPRDVSLQSTGIRYPEGFDLNTSGEIRGSVSQLALPEEGPVRFRLTSDIEAYTVLTVPRWYWAELAPELAEGAEVVVPGSKTLGADGNLYIVAQEVRSPASGKVLTFRDRLGAPLWMEPRGVSPSGAAVVPPRPELRVPPVRPPPGGMHRVGPGRGGGR